MGRSKVQAKEPSFTQEADNIIIEYMQKWGHSPRCYSMIHQILPQYKSKRIRQRWKTILNPELDRKPLSKEEKLFIIKWVKDHQTLSGKIHWTILVFEMERRFSKLRSDNILKNFWNAEKRKRLSFSKDNEK
ncbi:hypothetical protein C1645_814662 [Glomus cerebriforme]|uniref:HTH myb-type domain-containing protein n=1 Tax=Glomus cerebriforme TaxID=658196 RepID=A0A397TGG2_9GLOM|nr:hypothetical protein C1645_814662 [Glomus cerebriforme]